MLRVCTWVSLKFWGQKRQHLFRHIDATPSQLLSACCSLSVSAISPLLGFLVVGLSNCIQRHCDLQPLIAPLGNQKRNWEGSRPTRIWSGNVELLKSRHSSQSKQETRTTEQPLYFYSALFSQDRAIKEHSGCQLDEVFFPAFLWQAKICSLAERIGLSLIVLLSPRWQFS